ncbi:MAG: hypothetical protein QOE77_3546 [Blastocatellia bacterium]|jgi:tetratricopeptide (TPR) repeat protein|nr:hypothetical protein [Blastocatellia bacterium]
MNKVILLSIVLLGYAANAQPSIRTGQANPDAANQQLAEAARLNSSAVKLYAQARYEEAATAAKRAVAIREKLITPDDELLAEYVLNLAEIQITLGKTSEAVSLYKRALGSYERRFGLEDRRLVDILHRLGLAYYRMGMSYETERLYKRSLAIEEKALGPDHPAVGDALFHLADFYQFQRQFKQADPLYQRLIAIREKARVDPQLLSEARDRYSCLLRKSNRIKEAAELEDFSFKAMNPTSRTSQPLEGGVLNGRAVNLVVPPYPPEAKTSRTTGRVTVRVLIDQHGRVIRACAIDGPSVFVSVAESAALSSTFTPTLLSGQQVNVSGIIIYNFR